VDSDRYGRTAGHVWLGNRHINRELAREGHARVCRKYLRDKTLLDDEARARENEKGLWGLPESQRVPPWEWRRGRRTDRSTAEQSPGRDLTCGSKRYCREMTSCAEARFYLEECGLTRLEGDGDGVPCEAVCR
jgi:hypothetical protein